MSNTREAWLLSAVSALRDGLFKRHGYQVPDVKVSVGFPGGRASKRAIGQHWAPEASEDKTGAVFISPVLDDSIRVLDVLVHELVHAVVGVRAGHGREFRKCAIRVGLTGKMVATVASEGLKTELKALVEQIGAYPHARLNLSLSPTKKQTTRMVKMECPNCGYVARAARSWLDTHGPLICPCTGDRMQTEG